MDLRSKKSILYTILTNISRILLALVLVSSGFVKAVDPKGTMYKLQEYTEAFSIDIFSNEWLLFFAIVLAAMEFLSGVFLLMGVYRKFMAFWVFLVFIIFTPFTLYVAVSDAVPDCGCFGDAIGMSNTASFIKNLFLLLLSIIVFLGHRRFILNITAKNRWMVVLFSFFYIAFVETISLSYIPVIDFRNYAIGNNLREMVQGEGNTYKVLLTYEKDGETRIFEQDNQPDDTWSFVESHSELVSKGKEPIIGDFSILDWESDYDITEDILADTGFVCILISESLEDASIGRVDKINDLYDYCLENNTSFFAATSSDEEEISLWRKRTGAEYPVYWADNILLRGMIRANPGILLIKDGIITGKWNVENMPEIEQIMSSETLNEHTKSGILEKNGILFWTLLFILPIIIIIIIDIITRRKKRTPKRETVPDVATDDSTVEKSKEERENTKE